jgi:hypothetical protein
MQHKPNSGSKKTRPSRSEACSVLGEGWSLVGAPSLLFMSPLCRCLFTQHLLICIDIHLSMYYLCCCLCSDYVYIYGPSKMTTLGNLNVIESSISGKIETKINLDNLTTIPMPCRGELPELRPPRTKKKHEKQEKCTPKKTTSYKVSDSISVLKEGLHAVRNHKPGCSKKSFYKTGH